MRGPTLVDGDWVRWHKVVRGKIESIKGRIVKICDDKAWVETPDKLAVVKLVDLVKTR